MLFKAAKFAQRAHFGQVRKYSGEPYITHPFRVANAVMLHEKATEEMVAAAYLHDVIEDCGVEYNTVYNLFGEIVADLVLGLTNPSKSFVTKNRAERKLIDYEHLLGCSYGVKLIKMFDRLDNLNDMPLGEPFSNKYSKESLVLLEVISVDYELKQHIIDRCSVLQKAFFMIGR